VIGSGAGGAVTALELASAGRGVCVLEEGARHELAQYGAGSVQAMERLYRRRGMTPITGRSRSATSRGRASAGARRSTAASGTGRPREVLLRYKAQFDLQGASPEELDPHFEWAEERLHVSLRGRPWPKSTQGLRARHRGDGVVGAGGAPRGVGVRGHQHVRRPAARRAPSRACRGRSSRRPSAPGHAS
jgi:choline dehydrogenase-like flavoprotein